MPPVLSRRYAEAFAYASALHARQVRKGTNVPYLSHLMSVSALVLEDGGDEDEAIAGLLHDAVEDQGGRPTLEEIERRFGEKVARIVLACSDSETEPKPPWRERKERYVAHIRHAEADVRRVSSADKLHNARSILADYRVIGDLSSIASRRARTRRSGTTVPSWRRFAPRGPAAWSRSSTS